MLFAEVRTVDTLTGALDLCLLFLVFRSQCVQFGRFCFGVAGMDAAHALFQERGNFMHTG